MATVTIHDLYDGRVLAFDLHDLLRLLAPSSLEARWTITSNEEDFFATGEGGARLEELAATAAEVTGIELLALADDTAQVIWGDFIGVLPDDGREPWITIRAVDSSFYEVMTYDSEAIFKIKTRFADVRDAD